MRTAPRKNLLPPKDSKPKPPDSERERFTRFAKKLVNVPKKEIDEKAKEWKERKSSEQR